MIKVNPSKWEYLKESILNENEQRFQLLAITFDTALQKLLQLY